MNQKQILNKLYKECGLDKEDTFRSSHYNIITRGGIEKIMAKKNIAYDIEKFFISEEMVVYRIRATMTTTSSKETESGHEDSISTKTIVTTGEWNITHAKKKKDGELVPYYASAMAEKRGVSRAVLKLMNLYEHGVFGEDEDFYDADEPVTQGQITKIEALLRTSLFDSDYRERVEKEMLDYSGTQAGFCIEELENNQQDHTQRSNLSQTEIKNIKHE